MPDVILRAATIVDVDAETIRGQYDIELTGETISRIAPTNSRQTDRQVQVVDCTNAFVMPGLVDAHIHLVELGEALLCVANGVTTVRHMDGSPLQLAMERAFPARKEVAPTVHTASPIIDGAGPGGFPTVAHAMLAPAPEDTPALVAQLASRGYRQVKVYDQLSPRQHRALCIAAAEQSMSVAGHCPRALTMERAMDNGQRCFEHLSAVTRGRLLPRSGSESLRGAARILDAATRVDYASVAKLGQIMTSRKVWLCPTTQALGSESNAAREWSAGEASVVDYLNPAFRVRWQPPESVQVGGLSVPWKEYADALETWNRAQLRCLEILIEAGVPILAGTDFPTPGVVPGFALHDELVQLTSLGATNWQALRAATSTAAQYLAGHMGVAELFGSVRPGHRADLVILDCNPSRELTALRQPRAVVLRGRCITAEELRKRLTERRRAVAQVPALPGKRTEVRGAMVGEVIDLCGEHILHRGRFWHRRTADRWYVREHWTTVGDVRDRLVELELSANGTIERGSLRTDWHYAAMHSSIVKSGASYLVTVVHQDGKREERQVPGPLTPSEQLGWSAFAICLATGVPIETLWDGAFDVATVSVGNGDEVVIRRPTGSVQLAVRTKPEGHVEATFAARSGQLAYPRSLKLLLPPR